MMLTRKTTLEKMRQVYYLIDGAEMWAYYVIYDFSNFKNHISEMVIRRQTI